MSLGPVRFLIEPHWLNSILETSMNNELKLYHNVSVDDIKCVDENMDHQMLDHEKSRMVCFMNRQLLRDLDFQYHAHGLYTGTIRGGRSARIKKVIKNLRYWLRRWDSSPFGRTRVDVYKDTIDSWGNAVMHIAMDFKRTEHSYDLSDGRIIIYLNSEPRTSIVMNRFVRVLARAFPNLIGKRCKIKYVNKFTVSMTVWFDPYNYCKVDVYDYSLGIHDQPLISNANEMEKKREQENRNIRFAAGGKFSYGH